MVSRLVEEQHQERNQVTDTPVEYSRRFLPDYLLEGSICDQIVVMLRHGQLCRRFKGKKRSDDIQDNSVSHTTSSTSYFLQLLITSCLIWHTIPCPVKVCFTVVIPPWGMSVDPQKRSVDPQKMLYPVTNRFSPTVVCQKCTMYTGPLPILTPFTWGFPIVVTYVIHLLQILEESLTVSLFANRVE